MLEFNKMDFKKYYNIIEGIEKNNQNVDIWLLAAGPYAKII